MASIIVQLNTIKNDPDGQDVLDAIASGAEVINDDEFDISRELNIIRNPANRYGIDIRMAIHDALKKLQDKTSGEGGGGICSSDVAAISPGFMLRNVTGQFEFAPTPDGTQINTLNVGVPIYSNSIPYGNYGQRVAARLAIPFESSHTELQNGGWSASGMCYYEVENQIGAYAGYEFNVPQYVTLIKLWISRYSGQNVTLYVTVQYKDANGNWNDIEPISVTTDIAYPSNVERVTMDGNTPVYGVRWIHNTGPVKSGGNNITFAGMTVYRANTKGDS